MINKLKSAPPYKGAQEIDISIAVGANAQDKNWKTISIPWANFVSALSGPVRTPETFQEYKSAKKEVKSKIKDVGGFMGGALNGPRRLNKSVTSRSLLTLDFDGPEGQGMEISLGELIEVYQERFNNEAVLYTTHSHEASRPRVRLVIPLRESIPPNDYKALAQAVATELAPNDIDTASYVLSQFMFWPSSSKDGEYRFIHLPGELMDPQTVMDEAEIDSTGRGDKKTPNLIDVMEMESERSEKKLTEEQIIQKASDSNGDKFKNLFFKGPGTDHSVSDLSLCNILAFWTGKDSSMMDEMFRKSALYRPKWDEIHDPQNNLTYGQMTIEKAILGTSNVYGGWKNKKTTAGEDIPYFESGNMYWKRVKKNNGEETGVPISNFVLRPIREVEILETGQTVTECLAVNVVGISKNVNVEPSDFNTNIKFNDAVDSKSMRFNGTQTDLQFIKSLLDNHIVPTVTGTQTNGFHVIDDTMIYVDSAGIVGGDTDSIVTMADSPIKSSLSTEKQISYSEMLEILPFLFNFNTKHNTTSILGWTCATFLKAMFKSQGVKTGHLFISGSAGSGKSETVDKIIRPMLGIDTSPINANDQTKYALGIISNASNQTPILIEEYKPGNMRKDKIMILSDLMRNSYDSHLAIRGLPNRRGKTETLTLSAPLVIVGEESTSEKANLERSIFCTFGRESSRVHLDNFMELRKREKILRKLGRSILEQAMNMTPEKIMAMYKKADSIKSLDEIGSSRTRNNIVVSICGLYLLNDVIKDLGISFDISDEAEHIIANAQREEDENEAGLTRVDDMMNEISFVCGTEFYLISRTLADPVFIDISGTLLYLRIREVYDATNSYIKRNGLEKDWMPFGQFRKQLKQAIYYDDNRKVINTRRGVDHLSAKAWTFDMIQMERAGLELEGFKKADHHYKYILSTSDHG